MVSAEASAVALKVFSHSSDLSIFPTAYASSLAQRIGVPFPATTSPGSSSALSSRTISSQPIAPSSSDLSTPAKAGIGVGVSLGIFLLAAISLLILLRRRQQRKLAAAYNQPNRLGIPEMEDQDTSLVKRSGSLEVSGAARQRSRAIQWS